MPVIATIDNQQNDDWHLSSVQFLRIWPGSGQLPAAGAPMERVPGQARHQRHQNVHRHQRPEAPGSARGVPVDAMTRLLARARLLALRQLVTQTRLAVIIRPAPEDGAGHASRVNQRDSRRANY